MNKQDFLKELSRALSGLPREDLEERLAFYSEMIDDRMEDGLSEEEAVADIGSIDEAASQIIESAKDCFSGHDVTSLVWLKSYDGRSPEPRQYSLPGILS